MKFPKRVKYSHTQLLRADDFIAEQDYHITVRNQQNKLFKIPGVAYGLEITPGEAGSGKIVIQPGMAIDGNGQQIVLLESYDPEILSTTSPTTPGDYFLTVKYLPINSTELEDNNSAISPDSIRLIEQPTFKLYSTEGEIPTDEVPLAKISVDSSRSINIFDKSVYAAPRVNLVDDKSIDTAQLADKAVKTGKLDDLVVDTAQLADKAVKTGKLDDLVVDTAQLADNAVNKEKLNDSAVSINKLEMLTVPSQGNATIILDQSNDQQEQPVFATTTASYSMILVKIEFIDPNTPAIGWHQYARPSTDENGNPEVQHGIKFMLQELSSSVDVQCVFYVMSDSEIRRLI